MPIQSIFGNILQLLVEGHPEIIGAVFSAWDGEAVDLYHRDKDNELDVMCLGAHLGIIVNLIKNAHESLESGSLSELIVTTQKSIYVVIPVDRDYYIGLWSTSLAPLGWAKKRLETSVTNIKKEM